MANKTLNERMDEVEEAVRVLTGIVMEIKGVISISKKVKVVACGKPGPRPNKKKIEAAVRRKLREEEKRRKLGFKRPQDRRPLIDST